MQSKLCQSWKVKRPILMGSSARCHQFILVWMADLIPCLLVIPLTTRLLSADTLYEHMLHEYLIPSWSLIWADWHGTGDINTLSSHFIWSSYLCFLGAILSTSCFDKITQLQLYGLDIYDENVSLHHIPKLLYRTEIFSFWTVLCKPWSSAGSDLLRAARLAPTIGLCSKLNPLFYILMLVWTSVDCLEDVYILDESSCWMVH